MVFKVEREHGKPDTVSPNYSVIEYLYIDETIIGYILPSL